MNRYKCSVCEKEGVRNTSVDTLQSKCCKGEELIEHKRVGRKNIPITGLSSVTTSAPVEIKNENKPIELTEEQLKERDAIGAALNLLKQKVEDERKQPELPNQNKLDVAPSGIKVVSAKKA